MLMRFFPWLATLCLVAIPSAARPAEEKAAPPTVVVRIQPIDHLRDNLKYLGQLAGREREVEKAEAALNNQLGDKGLEGLDTKRPLGLYGRVGPAGSDSTGVVLLPVTDDKAFLDLLKRLKLTIEEGKDGVYTVQAENIPLPFYLRFADQYACLTVQNKSSLDKDQLLTPVKVLPAGKPGLLAASLRIDQIPEFLKQIGLTQFELQLADAKEKKPAGETPAQQTFREQTIDAFFAQFASIIRDGSEVSFRVDLDRKTHNLAIEASLGGKPKTVLAANIAELGQAKSLFSGLLKGDAAMNVLVHATLPESLRNALSPVIDDEVRKALAKEKDEAKRQQAEVLLKALVPSFKAGELDAAISLRPAAKGKHYTLVAAAKLKDGAAVEKALRDVLQNLPEAERAKIKLDAETAGEVKLHRIDAQHDFDANARQLLGEHPVYAAFRSNAVFVAVGPEAASALKEAVAMPPQSAPPVQVELSLGRLAQVMARDQKAAPGAAKKAFGEGKDDDKIRVTVEGGSALKARFEMKTAVIKFFRLLEQGERSE